MLKSVTFDEFSSQCPYFYTFGDGYINGGYNCKHPDQREAEDVWYKEKKRNVGAVIAFHVLWV